jgi:hypothetical protein
VHLVKSLPWVLKNLTLVALLALLYGKAQAAECGNPAKLWAGQDEDIGTVCVEATKSALHVTFTVDGSWLLDDLHLWVGVVSEVDYDVATDSDCSGFSGLPMTRPNHYACGNAKPGQFPYKAESVGDNTYTFVIDNLGEICSKDLLIVAHADVLNGAREEGAWAADHYNDYILTGEDSGERPRGNWALYFPRKVNCDFGLVCETAYAEGKTTFNDWTDVTGLPLQGDKKWGWVLGPFYSPFIGTTETFDLYAGAGQNDAEKGELSGYVSVDYVGVDKDAVGGVDSTDVSVSFHMLWEEGWYVTSLDGGDGTVHVFVGSAEEFTTTAPGQYTTQSTGTLGVNSLSVNTVNTTASPFYVVAHAEVCQVVNP